MSDIFLSYAREDRLRARPVVDALERKGWSVFWDPRIVPGRTWDQMLQEELDAASCIIVLWSRESVRSEGVANEAHEGRRRGILVPVLIDDLPIENIPLWFRRIQAAELIGWTGSLPHAGFESLAQAVEDVLNVPAAGNALTSAVAAAATDEPRTEHVEKRQVSQGAGQPQHVFRATREYWRKPRFWLIAGPLGLVGLGTSIYLIQMPKGLRPKEPTVVATDTKNRTRINPIDGLTYVFIPPGKFMMGCSPGDDECANDEKPPREVQVTNGFWLGQTEVTQAAWKKVNTGINPSEFKGDQLPVEQVAWIRAEKFCKDVGGTLPTEEQWEYAARGWTTGPQYGALDSIAWYATNSGNTTHPVRLKQPNAFGLYDMLGNVWEWTSSDHPT